MHQQLCGPANQFDLKLLNRRKLAAKIRLIILQEWSSHLAWSWRDRDHIPS